MRRDGIGIGGIWANDDFVKFWWGRISGKFTGEQIKRRNGERSRLPYYWILQVAHP